MPRFLFQLVRAATCVYGLVLLGPAFARAESASDGLAAARGPVSGLMSAPSPGEEKEAPAEQEIQRHRTKARLNRQMVGEDGASLAPREVAPLFSFLNPAPEAAPAILTLPDQTAIPRPRHFSAPRSCLSSSDSSDSTSLLS